MAVAAAHRGRGLGTTLLDELETRLRARGCRRVYLLVSPDNPEALDFYRRRGWEAMPVTMMGKNIA